MGPEQSKSTRLPQAVPLKLLGPPALFRLLGGGGEVGGEDTSTPTAQAPEHGFPSADSSILTTSSK